MKLPRPGFVHAAAFVALTLLLAAPAAAQGGFFSWFGNSQRQNSHRQNSWFGGGQRQYAPQGHAYSDPGNPSDRPYSPYDGYRPSAPAVSTGRAVSYCVRLCDGRYFPIQRHANASAVQLCGSFCPAAKTQVFNGSQIDHAVASNGARYADIDNAFVYRQKIVTDCSCNGKDSFGLARIDVTADPTLRATDIVATGDNVKAALIAMHAAKERARDAAERPALRGTARRTASTAPVAPAAPAAPAEATEDLPED